MTDQPHLARGQVWLHGRYGRVVITGFTDRVLFVQQTPGESANRKATQTVVTFTELGETPRAHTVPAPEFFEAVDAPDQAADVEQPRF